MVVYEIYWQDEGGEVHFIGALPERRKTPERITRESITRWGGIVLGEKTGIDLKSIYFKRAEVWN